MTETCGHILLIWPNKIQFIEMFFQNSIIPFQRKKNRSVVYKISATVFLIQWVKQIMADRMWLNAIPLSPYLSYLCFLHLLTTMYFEEAYNWTNSKLFKNS